MTVHIITETFFGEEADSKDTIVDYRVDNVYSDYRQAKEEADRLNTRSLNRKYLVWSRDIL